MQELLLPSVFIQQFLPIIPTPLRTVERVPANLVRSGQLSEMMLP